MKLRNVEIPIKKYRVASSRVHPDTGETLCYYIVEVYSDGKIICDCPAIKKHCRHYKIVEKYLQNEKKIS